MALSTYLITNLGEMATFLGWTTASTEITQIIEDTLEILSLDDESDSTDAVALKAVARYIAWSFVVNNLSVDYDFKADGADVKRNQMFKAAQANLSMNKISASPYMDISQIIIGELSYTEDPYEEDDIEDFADFTG